MNKFFWISIFCTAFSLLLWFVWWHPGGLPVKWMLIGWFLILVGFIIWALPDPNDQQDAKGWDNWRAWVPIILSIAGIIIPAYVYTQL